MNGAVLTRNDDALELDISACRGSDFQDAKEKIKEVTGRRFDFERKVWIAPATAQNADRILKTIRPQADEALLQWVRASMTQSEESLTAPLPDDAKELKVPWAYERCEWQPETVNDEPFNGLLDYQRAAVEAMAERSRAVLADDMGLGKTLEAISAVEEWRLRHPDVEDGPKLVVCPSSVKGSWKRELERWLPPGTEVAVIAGSYSPRKATASDHIALGHTTDAQGNMPLKLSSAEVRRLELMRAIERNAWVVVNWEQLRIEKFKAKTRNGGTKTVTQMRETLFEETEWLAVIADEVHRAKNKDAKQSRGLWRVAGRVMYGLTGTPLMNSPDELWSILRWLWPEQYHELGARVNAQAYWAFYEDFVDYYEDFRKRKVITGVKNADALRFILKDKLIRRTAAILGLKGRKRFYFDVELTPKQQKLYNEAEKAMWLAVEKDIAAGNKDALEFARAAVENGSVANLIRIPNGASRLVRLQQILENCALIGGDDESALMDDFEERYEDSRPSQWVVFCKYKESCTLLADRLRRKYDANVAVYTGDAKPTARTQMEDDFQRGDLDVVVGTIDAMKEGITLTSGHLMYFLTRSFVPDINEQCEAREDRLGQQELVRVYIPQPSNTVSADKVEPINQLKSTIVRTVLPKDHIEEVFE
jgi:SNF2 family DNA or RNA helicase